MEQAPMSTLSNLIADYAAGPTTLRKAVQGMTREQLKAKPIAGKWSTLEVVVHIADFDPILADRMKRIIAEENPPLIGANENHFAAALAYGDRDLEEELSIVDKTRSQMVRILRTLPDSALQRIGTHSERGPRTLEQVLVGATNHITHHLKFVAEKKQALGLPA
jgi:uncharacterized damage-inducible protein DinB